jgi:tRNA threonylcarbamoyladenosine biosynthesis protein TsaE
MEERGCSSQRVEAIAKLLAKELQAQDCIVLEGSLGVGKTFFARALLKGLKIKQASEGSPTFALVHEYQSGKKNIVHMDLYRIKSELELEEIGIPSYFWEKKAIVISEWLSLWPQLLQRVKETHRCWVVTLDFNSSDSEKRNIAIKFSVAAK